MQDQIIKSARNGMFEVKIIEDSIHNGVRLTTMQLAYPRFIHQQLLTHRAFSRNSSSSRAIPVERMIQDVLDKEVTPIEFGINKPGMQASEALGGHNLKEAEFVWYCARKDAVYRARQLAELGVHKQVVNRLLEPFQQIRTIVTATDWDNFFALRCDDAAQPEIQLLANLMREAMDASAPKDTIVHIPYITQRDMDMVGLNLDALLALSAARCARVSYLNHDGGQPDIDKDIKLAQTLREHRHMSPFEHQATAQFDMPTSTRFGNFRGWASQRYFMERKDIVC